MNIILQDYESVIDPTFDLKINVGDCDLYFMVQYFALYLEDIYLCCMNIIYGIMRQYDPMFDLKINVGHFEIYFMVQLFCLIS